MSARRCGHCNLAWPTDTFCCPVCGKQTIYSVDAEPGEPGAGVFLMTADRVEMHRLSTLIEAGYPVELADKLAVLPWHEVDLHVACELLEHGCPVEVAADILL